MLNPQTEHVGTQTRTNRAPEGIVEVHRNGGAGRPPFYDAIGAVFVLVGQ